MKHYLLPQFGIRYSKNNMSCFVFSMQYPFSGCGLLSKKQYAASAAIILMMKLFTDLCLECTSCAVFLSMSLMVSMMHLFRSITLSHIGMSLFFMFALIPVTRWMPSSKSISKSLGEIYPLSATGDRGHHSDCGNPVANLMSYISL